MESKNYEEFKEEFVNLYNNAILKFNENRILLKNIDAVIITQEGNCSDLSMMPMYLWQNGCRDAHKVVFDSFVFFKYEPSDKLLEYAKEKCFGNICHNSFWRYKNTNDFDQWYRILQMHDLIIDKYDEQYQLKEMAEYLDEHQDDIIYNYLDEEWCLGRDGNPIVFITKLDNEVNYYRYKFSIRDLRKCNEFLKAMLTDEDVNHNLGIAEDAEEYRAVVDWFSSEDDKIPCTACGMQNFVDGYCDADGNLPK